MEMIKKRNKFHRFLLTVICILLLTVAGFIETAASGEAVRFEAKGHIDQIDQNTIVIDDASYRLSVQTGYFKADGKGTTKSALGIDDLVSFKANTQGKMYAITIESKRARKREPGATTTSSGTTKPSTKSPSGVSKKIFLKDGVWQN